MFLSQYFANKIAFIAKQIVGPINRIAFLISLTALSVGCQKKEVKGHAPDFQFQWVGFSTQEKNGKLYLKRFGAAQENPKLHINLPKGSTEKLTNRHTTVECDSHEIFNKVEPLSDIQFDISFANESMPLLRSLPQVSTCSVSLTVFNEEGSSHTENLQVALIQDSAAPFELIDETPERPIVASPTFQLRNLRIKNTSELSEKFFVKDSYHFELKKIFLFDPSMNGSSVTFRFSEDWVKTYNFHVSANGQELSPTLSGHFVFELQPQQEVRVIVTTSLPGGNCSADTMASVRLPWGEILSNNIPRHYKGALIHAFETDYSYMQFETIDSPMSDLVTSRRNLEDNLTQVGVYEEGIKSVSVPIDPGAYRGNTVSAPIIPILEDCKGILPSHLR